jgi:hypothetical protein
MVRVTNTYSYLVKIAAKFLAANRGLDACAGRVEVHHIAVGSGKRSDYAVVGLCSKHHDDNRTGTGFHGMGTRTFCQVFRVPGEIEHGLLVWCNEDCSKLKARAQVA